MMLPTNNTPSFPWLDFHDPFVRALAFAIGSPPLIQSWPNPHASPEIELPSAQFWHQQLTQYWPRLQHLDANPTPLIRHIRPAPHMRLGYFFEDLLAFWLSDTGWHPFVLLEHGLQHHDAGRTQGELDFLIENLDTGEIEHWEVCLKFYLGESALRPANWVGLQQQDTLGRKLHHLQHKQFAVRRIHGMTIHHRRAIVKGRLFWPSSCTTLPIAPSDDQLSWLAPEHLSGLWLDHIPRERNDLPHWYRLSRLEWLAPHRNPPIYHGPSTRYWHNGLYLNPLAHAYYMLRLKPAYPPPYQSI